MHNLLNKLLKKRGIEDAVDLSAEERTIFTNWETVLGKEKMTLEDVEMFCQSQISIIKQKWSDYNVSQSKKSELIPYFTVYNALLGAINSPQVARAALETQLIEMIK